MSYRIDIPEVHSVTQFSPIPLPRRLGHDTASFFLAVLSLICAAFAGYGAAALLIFPETGFLLSGTDPYAGCQIPAEYVVRCAELCLPVLLQTVLVWISAYVVFERTMLTSLFSLHGLSVGSAIYAVIRMENSSRLAYLLLADAAIIAVHLILTRAVRRDSGRVPFSESLIYMLTAAGAASAIKIAASLLSL